MLQLYYFKEFDDTTFRILDQTRKLSTLWICVKYINKISPEDYIFTEFSKIDDELYKYAELLCEFESLSELPSLLYKFPWIVL